MVCEGYCSGVLPADDESKAVDGVISVVHEHLDIIQDTGGEADVFHVIEIWVKALCKTAQTEGLAHAGVCGEHADATRILQIVQAL